MATSNPLNASIVRFARKKKQREQSEGKQNLRERKVNDLKVHLNLSRMVYLIVQGLEMCSKEPSSLSKGQALGKPQKIMRAIAMQVGKVAIAGYQEGKIKSKKQCNDQKRKINIMHS